MRDDRTEEQKLVDARLHGETLTSLELNDPPIEVNQTWSISDDVGVIRQLRILAQHPDTTGCTWKENSTETQRQWIYIDTAKGRMRTQREMGVIPEYNLRRIFALDESA